MIPGFQHTQAACVNWVLSWGLPELDDLAELLSHCEEMPTEEWRERFGELVDALPQEWSQTKVFRQIESVMGDCLEWMSPIVSPQTRRPTQERFQHPSL